MPPAGLEPALCFQKGILSPSCLPISPQWHRKELPIYDSSYNTIETVLCQELLLDFAAVQLRIHAVLVVPAASSTTFPRKPFRMKSLQG